MNKNKTYLQIPFNRISVKAVKGDQGKTKCMLIFNGTPPDYLDKGMKIYNAELDADTQCAYLLLD